MQKGFSKRCQLWSSHQFVCKHIEFSGCTLTLLPLVECLMPARYFTGLPMHNFLFYINVIMSYSGHSLFLLCKNHGHFNIGSVSRTDLNMIIWGWEDNRFGKTLPSHKILNLASYFVSNCIILSLDTLRRSRIHGLLR